MSNSDATVLVIDDSGEALAAARQALGPEGLRPRRASPEEALALAGRDAPALVLLDLDLPGERALALCRQLAGVPVLGLARDAQSIARALEAGATDCLTRPLDPVELRARTRAALRTQRRLAELQAQAQLDALTGLGNRRAFDARLERELACALREGRPLSVVMLDLDHFKQLNDQHGHGFGDRVLRRVAEAIASCLRAGDAACRYGGEEFALVLRGCGAAGAAEVAERVRQRVGSLRLAREGRPVSVTASLGYGSTEELAGAASLADLADALVETADAALYAAKRSGRNRTSSPPSSVAA